MPGFRRRHFQVSFRRFLMLSFVSSTLFYRISPSRTAVGVAESRRDGWLRAADAALCQRGNGRLVRALSVEGVVCWRRQPPASCANGSALTSAGGLAWRCPRRLRFVRDGPAIPAAAGGRHGQRAPGWRRRPARGGGYGPQRRAARPPGADGGPGHHHDQSSGMGGRKHKFRNPHRLEDRAEAGACTRAYRTKNVQETRTRQVTWLPPGCRER